MIGSRISRELKTALEEAAMEQDRSLCQEAERRSRRDLLDDAIDIALENEGIFYADGPLPAGGGRAGGRCEAPAFRRM
jgi:hypothetical protein